MDEGEGSTSSWNQRTSALSHPDMPSPVHTFVDAVVKGKGIAVLYLNMILVRNMMTQ